MSVKKLFVVEAYFRRLPGSNR